MKTLEFVIPIFNEETCVDALLQRLEEVRSRLTRIRTSFLFINDGSKDTTLARLRRAAQNRSHVKVINLSRNFGHQIALTAGLDMTDADYVCVIDGDLQDPPELVEPMLELIEKGYDVVYGQRSERRGETYFKKITAKLFYKMLNHLCRVEIPRDTGDFRLMTRKVVLAFRKMRERHRFIRGMIPWLGFNSVAFPYERDRRFAGETKYPLRRMLRFAMDAVLSFSNVPLRLASYVGIFLVGVGFFGVGFMLYIKLFTDRAVPGITVVLISLLVIGGFQIIFMGLIGEYIGRLFEEAKGRPIYVIMGTDNIETIQTEHEHSSAQFV